MCKGTDLPSSLFSEWKRGESTPKADKLKKIANYFGISVEYLMTGTEEPEEKKNPYSDLKGIYLSYAREAQDSGIDPDDIHFTLDTIRGLRGEKWDWIKITNLSYTKMLYGSGVLWDSRISNVE